MIWTLASVATPHWSIARAVMMGCAESNWPVWSSATIDSPVPRAPSSLENHLTVMSSPSGSETTAESATAAPKRCPLSSSTAVCEDRFFGEMISTVGGRFPGGMASVEVVVVGCVVVVIDVVVVFGVEVVVVVGAVVVVVLDVVPSSGAVVDEVPFGSAAAVAVGSSMVESVSSADGEHAATTSSAAPISATTPTGLRLAMDTPTESRTAFRRPDRRTLRSCLVRVTMRLVASSIP